LIHILKIAIYSPVIPSIPRPETFYAAGAISTLASLSGTGYQYTHLTDAECGIIILACHRSEGTA
jgi:hypothetical protein